MVNMGRMSTFKWLLLLFVLTRSPTSVQLASWTHLADHMFQYGPNTGDELIPVDQLPVMKPTHHKPMFGTGVPYDNVKVFADGHLELWYDGGGVQHTIPYIAPYHLPYSKVTSGHVWYRETQDPESLNQVSIEIQKAFPDGGFTVDPDSMVVVTWQWSNVTARYPECEAQQRADNTAFCDCLDAGPQARPIQYVVSLNSKYHHMVCECLHNVSSPVGIEGRYYFTLERYCQRLYMIPDYKMISCDTCMKRYYYYYHYGYQCACEAMGGSSRESSCAWSHGGKYPWLGLNGAEACEYCKCTITKYYHSDKHYYCLSKFAKRYKALGKLKSFYKASLYGHINEDRSCSDDDVQVTEQKLMGCLSRRYGYPRLHFSNANLSVFCGDLDLEYCSCLQDMVPGDPDGDLYCKCDVLSGGRSADLCQCLVDYGYKAALPDCNQTRVAPRISCAVDNTSPQQNMQAGYMNTFQAVIVYNEWQTFVYFTYQKLQYSDTNIQTRIGYIDTTSSFTGYNHPYTDDDFLQRLLMFDSNLGVEGRWLYRVGDQIQEQHWTPQKAIAHC